MKLVSAVHQLVEAAGRIEQGILGVQVEMDEIRVRHRLNLGRGGREEQAGDIRRHDASVVEANVVFCAGQAKRTASPLTPALSPSGICTAPPLLTLPLSKTLSTVPWQTKFPTKFATKSGRADGDANIRSG